MECEGGAPQDERQERKRLRYSRTSIRSRVEDAHVIKTRMGCPIWRSPFLNRAEQPSSNSPSILSAIKPPEACFPPVCTSSCPHTLQIHDSALHVEENSSEETPGSSGPTRTTEDSCVSPQTLLTPRIHSLLPSSSNTRLLPTPPRTHRGARPPQPMPSSEQVDDIQRKIKDLKKRQLAELDALEIQQAQMEMLKTKKARIRYRSPSPNDNYQETRGGMEGHGQAGGKRIQGAPSGTFQGHAQSSTQASHQSSVSLTYFFRDITLHARSCIWAAHHVCLWHISD